MISSLETRREFLSATMGAAAGVALGPLLTPSLAQAYVAREVGARRTLGEVEPRAVAAFRATLRGGALTPTDAGYDAARQVWNAAYDRHPGLIVTCAGPADVSRAINFARDHEVILAVRSGGHSLAGKSTCEGGLVIDLSRIKALSIDPAARVARAGAGLMLGEFDAATHAHGLAVTSGTEPTTGIAGLTLGGGLGWLMGKYGLACDNVRSVDMVLADGRQMTVNGETDPDLFWAIRGAGANFGIATAIEYNLHSVNTIFGGVIQYPLSALADALHNYRDFTHTLPDEVGIAIGIAPSDNGTPIVSLAVSHCGDRAAGEAALRPLRAFGPKLQDDVGPTSYLAFQSRGALPEGLRLSALIRSAFLSEISDEAIAMIAHWAAAAPPFAGSFVVEFVHGQVCRVGASDTAFPHRHGGHNFSIHADWAQPSSETASRHWGLSFWAAMQPFVRTAVYSNYLGDEGENRARAAYGANYPRLTELKRRYDPDNLFALNQNIVPAPLRAGAT